MLVRGVWWGEAGSWAALSGHPILGFGAFPVGERQGRRSGVGTVGRGTVYTGQSGPPPPARPVQHPKMSVPDDNLGLLSTVVCPISPRVRNFLHVMRDPGDLWVLESRRRHTG